MALLREICAPTMLRQGKWRGYFIQFRTLVSLDMTRSLRMHGSTLVETTTGAGCRWTRSAELPISPWVLLLMTYTALTALALISMAIAYWRSTHEPASGCGISSSFITIFGITIPQRLPYFSLCCMEARRLM